MTETPHRRARQWAATHQRVYDTALRLFQEHGFDAVNVGQIAREAGVSAPTFYAHYPSREHLVMQLPTADEMDALVASMPGGLPVGERIRRAVPLWFAPWSPEFREAQLARWRIVAGSKGLRTRAAEFERVSGGLLVDALRARGETLETTDVIVVHAYLSAYTAALLAWADCDGARKLEELMDEAFDALEKR